MKKHHIISIVNNKGGTGKTTTTINLADALGRLDKKVLVIDIDTQCNTTGKLLPKKTRITKSLFDILNPEMPNKNGHGYIYPTKCKNVSMIPNINATGNLEPLLIENNPDSLYSLKQFQNVFADYDITLIDCPPNMGEFVLIALHVSTACVIPVLASSSDSVEGLINAVELITKVQEKSNHDLRFLRALINGVDNREAISGTIVEQIRSHFKTDQVFKQEIPINTTFRKAEASETTILQYSSTARGSRAFRALAKELITILEN